MSSLTPCLLDGPRFTNFCVPYFYRLVTKGLIIYYCTINKNLFGAQGFPLNTGFQTRIQDFEMGGEFL